MARAGAAGKPRYVLRGSMQQAGPTPTGDRHQSMSGHVPADFREVSLAGAGLVDELAVEHHDQAI